MLNSFCSICGNGKGLHSVFFCPIFTHRVMILIPYGQENNNQEQNGMDFLCRGEWFYSQKKN